LRILQSNAFSWGLRLYEAIIGSAGCAGSNCAVGKAEYVLHVFRLGFPVFFVLLYDAEGVYPEVSNTEASSGRDGILKRLRQLIKIDMSLKIPYIGSVRAEDAMRTWVTPSMGQCYVL
jgi:hypothetical protein